MPFDPRLESPFPVSSCALKAEVMSLKGEDMERNKEEQEEMNKDVEEQEELHSEGRCVGEEPERRCLTLPGGVGDSERRPAGEEARHHGSRRTGDLGEGRVEQREVLAGHWADVTHCHEARDISLGQVGALVQWCVGEEVAQAFETCAEEAGRLLRRREELVRELLAEEEVLARAAGTLRHLLEQASGDLVRAHLHKHRLQEEVARVKRKLFAAAREVIQNQVALAAQQYEVAQLNLAQEELRAEELQRLQELERLREEHRHKLAALVEQAQGYRRPRATSDLSHCRRAAADIARNTRASMASLDDWYEPRLLGLLRRRQAAEVTLRKTRELGENLRSRLHPLTLEIQRLEIQRACLQQRVNLMEQERRESLALHRETVSALEDGIRDLQTELQVQINTNQELAVLNSCLTTKTALYRRCLGYTGD